MRQKWVVLAVMLAGCGDIEAEVTRALGADYDIPLTQEGPPLEIDVGRQVTAMEDQILQDPSSINYDVMRALCETEPGKDCSTPRFPTRIPKYLWPYGCIVTENSIPVFHQASECTMEMDCAETDLATIRNGVDPGNPPAGNGCVDVGKWIQASPGFSEMSVIAQAITYDVSDQGSLKNVKQVKKVRVDPVVIKFKENSYTYDIPLTKGFVGNPVSAQELLDAKALIASEKVKAFGTLTATPAGFTGDKRMSLTNDGKTRLGEALRGFKATVAAQLELVIPPATEAARADNCRDPNHPPSTSPSGCETFPKPAGKVKFAPELTIIFTVTAQGLF